MKKLLIILSLFLVSSCTSGGNNTQNTSSIHTTTGKEISQPTLGSGDHKLELYLDYQCPACINFSKTLGPILEKYAQDGKLEIIYKQFPLTRIHPNAYNDALAAMCAHADGKYIEYKKAIYTLEDTRKGAEVTDNDRVQVAKDIGLDQGKFNLCLEEKTYESRVKADMKEGDIAGVGGTPTLILDNKSLDLGMFRSEQMFQDFMNRYLGVTRDTTGSGATPSMTGTTATGA